MAPGEIGAERGARLVTRMSFKASQMVQGAAEQGAVRNGVYAFTRRSSRGSGKLTCSSRTVRLSTEAGFAA